MSSRSIVSIATPTRPLAHATAALLRAASALLERLAERLSNVSTRAAAARSLPSHVEFHAEAGAPEGALYADGVLIGVLPGITRL